ncbi:uncharacterized protein TRIADDRAFT_64137 [Trichoplax adhaerens]|uniref:cystathionine gamma-lyase n=1 Tax=Trichoplax adhaerens TaxID=10228 RepID=B3S3V3_TRIAD|nr:hypothetical protein TRIADDRAFT_64137 [Trichoplax adhaerens]EDV22530.1 hypothetical protein TRIADDRAFT_64137 [Trichoplax adhaerens]|eukprot:XP_002115074.1 hypothetical protein TRIADDRAFT_64137 [Trichoplax adhaerens]
MAENTDRFDSFSTVSIHTGQDTRDELYNCRSGIPPIYLSTIFRYPEAGKGLNYVYSRDLNPNRAALESAIAKLEDGKYCNAFSSGTAAISALGYLIKAGDHVICPFDVYGGTSNFWKNVANRFNIEVSFIDTADMETLEKTFKSNTKILWLETPTNPCLRVTDLEGAVKIARKHKDILIVADNTFATPYFQRPLSYGIDMVLHSLSKYINGHSDVIMGAIVSNSEDIYRKLESIQINVGSIPSPFDCFLVNRGLKTLSVRMERHQKNALAIAKYLEQSPYARNVKYLGLPSHPQHELAKKQMKGFSGMVSFVINGTVEQAKKFLQSLKVILLTVSLGGVESVAELTPLMTRENVDQAELDKLEIYETFIRLSVGIEDTADLLHDIEQALHEALA